LNTIEIQEKFCGRSDKILFHETPKIVPSPTQEKIPAHEWPQVSILIVNYNGAEVLRDCLTSLRQVTYPRFEVVVVENGSNDDSGEVLRQHPSVRVLQSDHNRGFAGGNNFGLPACNGEFVLLLNSDTIVTPDFLQPLVEYLHQHSKVGIVQGKMILSLRGGALDACGHFLTRFGFLYHFGYYKQDVEKYDHSYPVFSAKGACLLFRRELVASVGGYLFNEDFFCYYEETDFCHRAWLTGHEVHFVHTSTIQHLQGATSERTQTSGFVLRQFLANQTFGLLANLSAGSRWRIMPLYFLIFLTSMISAALTGRGTVFVAHWHALSSNWRRLGKIRAQRELIRRIRKISDRELFAKVMRNPRLDYFFKTFQGRLSDYEDDNLN
jgi:GT2 family glycosyltransferase